MGTPQLNQSHLHRTRLLSLVPLDLTLGPFGNILCSAVNHKSWVLFGNNHSHRRIPAYRTSIAIALIQHCDDSHLTCSHGAAGEAMGECTREDFYKMAKQ